MRWLVMLETKTEDAVPCSRSHPEGGVLARMERIAVREALKEEAMLVHSAELWEKVNSFAGECCFSPDTCFSSHSLL